MFEENAQKFMLKLRDAESKATMACKFEIDFLTIPYGQKNIVEAPMNKYYEKMHVYVESLFPKQSKTLSLMERQSCACLTFSVTAPFLLVTFLICSIVVYNARPIYVSELYVDGFTRSSYNLCPHDGLNTRLVILVASAPENFEKRQAVRKTWGTYVSRPDITIAFVLGDPLKLYVKDIEKEESKYNDLIIGKCLDTYRYLTLKTLAMLKWTQQHCSKAKFVMKADDDSFLNVPAWLAITDMNATETNSTIWGFHMVIGSGPVRDKEENHYVAERQYRGNRYPSYVAGGAYMMSMDCVDPLVEAAFRAPYVGVEDVFLTGIIAEKVGIRRRETSSLNGTIFFFKSAIHKVRPRDQYILWHIFRMLNGKVMTVEETQLMSDYVTWDPSEETLSISRMNALPKLTTDDY